MSIAVGDYESILSGGVGHSGGTVPDYTEVLTRGHWVGSEEIDFTGVEILYPILPEARPNMRVFRKDDMVWTSVQKSESFWQHEYCKISYRVRQSNLATFWDSLVDARGKVVNLNHPGVQPFIRSDENNPVYVVNFTKPVREKPFYWKITVTYLRDPAE